MVPLTSGRLVTDWYALIHGIEIMGDMMSDRTDHEQSILDHTTLVSVIQQTYQLQHIDIYPLQNNTGKYIYCVEQKNDQRWILRLSLKHDQLQTLANVLFFLEQQHYPAERILPTHEQTTIGKAGDWSLLLTTFVAGPKLHDDPEAFQLLGSLVGHLHSLRIEQTTGFSLPRAGMLPARELAFAQRQLRAIEGLVPAQHRARYAMLMQAVTTINHCTDLPVVLLHNDCHPGNALLTPAEQGILIDWEGAGLGPAIIDVGFLLSNCDATFPWAPLPPAPYCNIRQATRLEAAIKGYCQYHQLTSRELDYLPDALQFRALVFGACRFAAAITNHENADELRWWWARYTTATEIADKARAHFIYYSSHLTQ
jgi:Ser/Thr protein kinase RdoA (MazF antagonist)